MRISDWISDGCPSDLFAPHSLSIPSRGTCRGPLVRQIASGDQVKEAAGDMAGAMSGGTEVAAGRTGEAGVGGAFVGRYDGRIMKFMAPQTAIAWCRERVVQDVKTAVGTESLKK